MKCFKFNLKNKKNCNVKHCRYWIKENNYFNCCLNYDTKQKSTLEEIGNLFNVTRMRICQIEKAAINKLKNRLIKK